jgi:hypothetical protein
MARGVGIAQAIPVPGNEPVRPAGEIVDVIRPAVTLKIRALWSHEGLAPPNQK